MIRCRTISIFAAVLAAPGLGLAAPASAASPREHFHDVFTETTEDFCDVPGLTVELVTTSDGRFRITPHGPDRLPYFQLHATDTSVYTNLATGESVTEVGRTNETQHHVVDNGDGTTTHILLNVHNIKTYNDAGQMIAHRTGQLRVELVFDDADTPTDPDDDELVSFRVIRSQGNGDDFCTAVVQAIG